MGQATGQSRRPRVVVHSAEAREDLAEIYAYTANQWGTEQADEYLDFLDGIMQRLADDLGLGSILIGGEGIRRYFARWKNARNGHHIFYEPNDEGIAVLRIFHSSRDWYGYFGVE